MDHQLIFVRLQKQQQQQQVTIISVEFKIHIIVNEDLIPLYEEQHLMNDR